VSGDTIPFSERGRVCSNVYVAYIPSVTTGRFVDAGGAFACHNSLSFSSCRITLATSYRTVSDSVWSSCVEHASMRKFWVSARVAFRRASASALALSASARAACAVNRCSPPERQRASLAVMSSAVPKKLPDQSSGAGTGLPLDPNPAHSPSARTMRILHRSARCVPRLRVLASTPNPVGGMNQVLVEEGFVRVLSKRPAGELLIGGD